MIAADAARSMHAADGLPLHVVEVGEGLCEPLLALLAEIGRSLGVAPRVVIVGPAAAARRAEAYGCRVVGQHCPPLRDPALAARSLRALLRGEVARSGVSDLVVWGSSTLAALSVGLSRGFTWVVLGVVPRLPAFLARRLRGVQAVTVNMPSESQARFGRWFEGVVPHAVEAALPDSASPDRVGCPIESREAIRHHWGADEETLVVGVFGPAPAWTDFRRAADVVGVAAVRGAKVRLVGHPACARAARTMRWMAEIGLDRHPLVLDARLAEPWTISAGLDLALLLADGARTAGADAHGQRWAGLSPALSRWWSGEPPIMAIPNLAALWLGRAGVPLLREREDGIADPAGDERLTFPLDEPIQATRTVLALADGRVSVGHLREAAAERASRPVLDPIWRRLFGAV